MMNEDKTYATIYFAQAPLVVIPFINGASQYMGRPALQSGHLPTTRLSATQPQTPRVKKRKHTANTIKINTPHTIPLLKPPHISSNIHNNPCRLMGPDKREFRAELAVQRQKVCVAEAGCFDADEYLMGFWRWDWDVIVDLVRLVVGVDLDCFHC